MKLIGLTGGIASGKSTAGRMLARAGVAVIDADVLARDAVAPGTVAPSSEPSSSNTGRATARCVIASPPSAANSRLRTSAA